MFNCKSPIIQWAGLCLDTCLQVTEKPCFIYINFFKIFQIKNDKWFLILNEISSTFPVDVRLSHDVTVWIWWLKTLFIYPSSTAYPVSGHGGSSLSRESKTSLCPVTSFSDSGGGGGSRGIPGPAEKHSPFSVSWLFPEASYQWDVSWTPHQGGILTRCPTHLIWVLSAWRSSGSTPSSSRMAELLNLSKGEPSHPTEEAHFSRVYLRSHSFRHYPMLMTNSEIRKKDRPVNRELCLSSHSPHHCRHRSHPPVDLLFHFPLTGEQDLLELLHYRQDLLPDLDETRHLLPAENRGLRFVSADSHPGRFTLGCDLVTDWWSQQDHNICKEQRPDPEITKPGPFNTMAVPQRAALAESNPYRKQVRHCRRRGPNSDSSNIGSGQPAKGDSTPHNPRQNPAQDSLREHILWSPFLQRGTANPICQSSSTASDVHAMLQSRVSHDSPTTSRALRNSRQILFDPGVLSLRSFLTTSATSAQEIRDPVHRCPPAGTGTDHIADAAPVGTSTIVARNMAHSDLMSPASSGTRLKFSRRWELKLLLTGISARSF